MDPMGLINPTVEMQAVAQMLAASPQWAQAKAEALAAHRDGLLHPDNALDFIGEILDRVGLGGEAIIAQMPQQYRGMLPAEAQDQLRKAFTAFMVASLAKEIESGTPLPMLGMAGGGVLVERQEVDGIEAVTVIAYVTPLQNPETVIAEFIETCYQVYPAEAFSRSENEVRDAEWWARHQKGATFRQIAMTDERSGLPPEARAFPKEYREDIRRAADKVRRGAQRSRDRWTKKLRIPSAD